MLYCCPNELHLLYGITLAEPCQCKNETTCSVCAIEDTTEESTEEFLIPEWYEFNIR